jgi:cytochrome b6-f complex iron-sulfur subunit
MGNDKITRRRAIDVILGSGLGALALATIYPLIKYIIPPETHEAGASSILAAKISELKPNEGKIFRFGNTPAIIILKPGGDASKASSYVAFSAVCPHLNCTVQYRSDIKEIWCACHNGHFDFNGNVISGPPPKPLKSYRVAIKGEEIYVSSQET